VHQAQKFVVFPVVLVSQVVEVGNLNNDIHALSGVSDFESGIALKTSKKSVNPKKVFGVPKQTGLCSETGAVRRGKHHQRRTTLLMRTAKTQERYFLLFVEVGHPL
jgi:hypothetical protein